MSGRPVFQYGSLAAPLVLPETSDWYAQRNAGEVTFAGSEWETLAEGFESWSGSGYLGGGALSTTFDQGGQQFIAGESAIYPMGVWFGATLATTEPDFEVGVFPSPTVSGTPALSNEYSLNYGLSTATKSQEAAEAFLTFITQDADAVRPQLQGDGLFSNAIDPVTYDLQGPLQGVADLMASVDKIASYAGTGDSVPPPGFSDYVNTQTQSLILGDLDAAAFVASLDQWWDENQL